MDYYIRILAEATEAPTPGEIGAAATRAGFAPATVRGADLTDEDWREIDLEYDGGRCPLRLERTVAPTPGELPEVARFAARIGKPGRSRAKKQILEMLCAARQVIALRVPDHVIEGDDWGMVHALLYFLQLRLDGIIQADGEGFYDRAGKLVVALE